MKSLPALLLALALPVAANAEATPQGGPLDIRIRTAVYNENQVVFRGSLEPYRALLFGII